MNDPATLHRNRRALATVKEAGKCEHTGHWRWQVVVGRDLRVLRTFSGVWSTTALAMAENYATLHNAARLRLVKS